MRSKRLRFLALGLAVLALVPGATAQALYASHNGVVSANPADTTPNVLDGKVTAILPMGNRMFVGGTFTQVQEVGAGKPVLTHRGLFSFDPATGAVDNSFVDVFAQGFDAGIRYDESLALDMIAVPLGPAQRYAIVASPDHVARHGFPERPEDLLKRPCIRHRFPSGAMLSWEFEKDGETVKIDPDGPLITTSPDLAIRAAEDGVGWYATFEGFVRPLLDAGRLVEALAHWCPSFPGPSLYYPSRRHVPAPLRAFIQFVRSEGLSNSD